MPSLIIVVVGVMNPMSILSGRTLCTVSALKSISSRLEMATLSPGFTLRNRPGPSSASSPVEWNTTSLPRRSSIPFGLISLSSALTRTDPMSRRMSLSAKILGTYSPLWRAA